MELLQNWKLQVFISLFSIVIIYHTLPVLVYLIFVLLAAVGGAALAVIHQPGHYKRRDNETFPKPPVSVSDVPLSKVKPYPPPSLKPKLLSPRIDDRLQEVLRFTLDYHVIPTYKLIGQDHDAFFRSITPNIWSVLLALLQRVGQVDTMKLVSQDIVQLLRGHFENFRGIHYRDPVPLNKFPDLNQFPYLENPEQELSFLRQVCEVFLCVTLPRELLECTAVRVFMREYMVCSILQPTIEMICDPDYINQKLLVYLTKKEEAMERGKKPTTYKYKDFEDFMSQIKKCEDVDDLQNLRQQIITDIIQATAVYKMKRSHTTGFHGKQFPIPIPAEKLKILMGRDLELYIRQLGTAKTSCDRQLRKQGGGEEYNEEPIPIIGTTVDEGTGERPLGIPFETIMKNEVAQIFFIRFLEECQNSHLLIFWLAAEKLQGDTVTGFHTSLGKLYDDYLSPLSSELVHAKPELLKPIQDFLSRKHEDIDRCMRHVEILKKSVYEDLWEGFYQNFICSEHFRDLMHQNSSTEGAFNPLENITYPFDSHADEESHHRKKLELLKTRLDVKDKELSLMPAQVQTSQSLSQRKRALQKDRFQLREEIKKLEHYLDHTEEWFDTIGQWSVEVHSVDLKQDEKNPLFVIIVHRPELAGKKLLGSDGFLPPQEGAEDFTQSIAWQHQQQHQQAHADGTSTVDSDDTWSEISSGSGGSILQSRSGWVIGRHLSEFTKLHEKVAEICPNLQFPPLPKWLNPFQRPDATSPYWQKYRAALQVYLCCVLKDERLKECEEVFNFVSSASDNLRTKPAAPQPEKKNRFSLSNVPVIQSFQRFSVKDSVPEETAKDLDSTAEYMYLLVSEIFELDHFSRVLRKQFMELVQLTYGKSIDREVQDTLNWLFSEPMLIFYLDTFKNSLWPDGKPSPPAPTRSDEEKAATKEEVRVKLLRSSPQALQTILGQRNCQIGMRKTFELLQDPKGNKQLFYALFEVLLYSLLPELDQVELDDDSSDWRDT